MLPITIDDILKATGGKLLCGDSSGIVDSISTDSRRIQAGDMFIPLVGENFDGHNFIKSAVEQGAAFVITHKTVEGNILSSGTAVIEVGDTLKALQDIAAGYKAKFPIPFAAVTGSVGKTSTKDMVASVLKEQYNVLSTLGNLNNEIGLPLTLLNLDNNHEAAVIEMGMSGFGEISVLTRIVRPDVAIITNIGLSHIERLGSRQNILKAKMEILEGLNKNGLVVLNGDDELLSGLRNLLPFRTVFYGMKEEADLQAFNVKNAGEEGTYFNITQGGKDYTVHIPLPGLHNLYNALAAIAVGLEFKIPMESIIHGIAAFTPSKMRLNILRGRMGMKIINDTYNASPSSMIAALDVLRDIRDENRSIAVLGDMLEMGEWAEEAHKDVGKRAAKNHIDILITVGENAAYIAEGAISAGIKKENVFSFKSVEDACKMLTNTVTGEDVILVKGSRGMKMEKAVEYIYEL